MEEKRAYPRINLNETAKYARNNKALTRDISLSGLRFRTNEKITSGTPLNLCFPLPERGLIKTTGKTVWTQQIRQGLYESGFQFVSIHEPGKLDLSEYINQELLKNQYPKTGTQILIDVLINCCIHAKAKTLNITDDGMKLFTASPLDEKKIILLSIPLPAGDSVSMHGKAVWNKRLKADLFENGIVFWNIDTIEKRKLTAFVKAD